MAEKHATEDPVGDLICDLLRNLRHPLDKLMLRPYTPAEPRIARGGWNSSAAMRFRHFGVRWIRLDRPYWWNYIRCLLEDAWRAFWS